MIGLLLAAGSAGLSAMGKLMGGKSEKAAAWARAAALEAGAKQARQEAGVAAMLALEEGERQQARAATLAAANGGGLGGSATGVLDDLSRQSIFSARTAAYQGETEARNKIYEAAVERVNGSNALRQAGVEAASSLLSSAANYYQQGQAIGAAKKGAA